MWSRCRSILANYLSLFLLCMCMFFFRFPVRNKLAHNPLNAVSWINLCTIRVYVDVLNSSSRICIMKKVPTPFSVYLIYFLIYIKHYCNNRTTQNSTQTLTSKFFAATITKNTILCGSANGELLYTHDKMIVLVCICV